ncbi:MAG: response regulator transcription factor [Oscillospiraceae bacterium]|nr:response regulator transcription factor [Oscillospiraceae bacterium]
MVDMLMIEDQTILRESLKYALEATGEFRVVAEGADAALAPELCEKFKPALALLDICTEAGSSGIAAAKKIKRLFPAVKVVMMTGMPDISFVRQARLAGADSFVYKNVGTAELISTLRSTLEGYSVFVSKGQDALPCYAQLTDKETEILRHVCEGMSREEIAAAMQLSENTVRSYISEILSKTGYSSILKLAVFAVANGYIAPLSGE